MVNFVTEQLIACQFRQPAFNLCMEARSALIQVPKFSCLILQLGLCKVRSLHHPMRFVFCVLVSFNGISALVQGENNVFDV